MRKLGKCSKLSYSDNPKFVVFYNGEAKTASDVVKLKLSDAFMDEDLSGEYEWTATMININAGHSRELMKACRILEEYAILIDLIREYRCTLELHDAIIRAVDECIEAGVLADVLMKYRKEIVMKIINDFTEEEFHEMLREEAFEEGVERGIAQGMERGMSQGMERGMSQGMERGIEQTIAVISMLKENASDETIMSKTGCSMQVIEQIRQEVLV